MSGKCIITILLSIER